MTRLRTIRSIAIGIAAWSLAAGSVAQAAPPKVGSISPLVALSVYGTAESRAAVSGQLAASAAQTAPGVILPTTTASLAQYDDRDGNRDLWIALAAMGVLVAAWFLLEDAVLGDDDDGGLNIFPPISPD